MSKAYEKYYNKFTNGDTCKSNKTNCKKELEKLNKKTKDPVTKIKLNEVISLIQPLSKTQKISDNDLVNLLQFCDLLTELEVVNA